MTGETVTLDLLASGLVDAPDTEHRFALGAPWASSSRRPAAAPPAPAASAERWARSPGPEHKADVSDIMSRARALGRDMGELDAYAHHRRTIERFTLEQAEAFRPKWPDIADALVDPTLSGRERRARVGALLATHRKSIHEEKARLLHDVAPIQKKMARLEAVIGAYEEMIAWAEKGPHKLCRSNCSRLHRLIGAIEDETAVLPNDDGKERNAETAAAAAWDWGEAHSFVVEHDWAAAFRGAVDYEDGAFRLPFEKCAFEFRINDRSVIVMARQQEDGPIAALLFVEARGLWVAGKRGFRTLAEAMAENGFIGSIAAQIRAVSIALDAAVATSTVVRTPEKLNRARVKAGKPPFFDYHVISLANRSRAERAPGFGGTHRSPRLHFRRGHWRHYETHKTWIRWTLVGNPDAGFIETEYRL